MLLIDDTWTTGSSAQSAAIALRAAGATSVVTVVIGRHVGRPAAEHAGLGPAAMPFRMDSCAVHQDHVVTRNHRLDPVMTGTSHAEARTTGPPQGCQEPSRTAVVRRARRINKELAELYPDAHTELDFTTPLELLVATILSAQTTDKGVNLVTPVLFPRYRTAADLAGADRDEVEKIIVTTGFFRAKTTSIIGLGQALCERFGGEVCRANSRTWSPCLVWAGRQ